MKLFLILIILSVCCCKPNTKDSISINSTSDSINLYYKKSLDTNLSLFEKQQEINKALQFAKSIKKENLYSRVLYQKNNLHLSSQEYDSLSIYNHVLNKHALKIKDYTMLSYQYYLMGYYHSEITKIPDSAFSNYNLSKNYFLKIKDSSWVGRNLLNIGTIEKDQNDFFGSKETLTEALHYLRPNVDLKYISDCYNVLATDHRKLSNYSDAIDYYLLALKSTNSSKEKLSYKNNLAATHIDNQEYNKAISLLNSISNDSLLINNKIEYARVLDNLAYAKWLSGINIREREFQNPLKIRVQNNDKRGQLASYTHLGEYSSKTNTKRAKTYFDSVIQLSKTIKKPGAEKDALKFLMPLQPKNVELRDRYVFLQDSLYAQELKVKTQFAKYKYDDKLKQEDILRLEKENAEQELKVIKQRNQKILTYAIGVPLFLLLGFLTYFFVQRSKRLKDKNKTAKLEATFETEAALSRKLHDDFGGKLNHAMLLLQNGADSIEVLDLVDGLYNQSRVFSREINDVDTGPNFKDFLFGMMGNYSKNTKLIVSGSTDVDWLKISPLSKKTLFKVLQELMINMQKHSNANLVSFAFQQTKKTLKVTYADDGAGASSEELNLKNGLWNTEKRIEAIGGTIIFDSEKGSGFEVQIGIPI